MGLKDTQPERSWVQASGGSAVLVKAPMSSRWTERSTGEVGPGIPRGRDFSLGRRNKNKEHKGDGSLHVQPADQDFRTSNALAVCCGRCWWGWDSFRPLA